MVLKPLEFSECLTDSPWFRQNLWDHEASLQRACKAIKLMEEQCQEITSAALKLSSAHRNFAKTLADFTFDTIGSTQTDDERVVANCFKEYSALILQVEDERERLLEKAEQSYVEPLRKFRVDCIGIALQDERKKFEKSSGKFYQSLEKHLHVSTNRKSDFKEADATLEMEQRHFYQASLDYVDVLQTVQERMKFEFVELISSFLYNWMTFYTIGHVIHEDFKPYFGTINTKVQKSKESFEATQQEAQQLKSKMLNNLFECSGDTKGNVKQGYLFLCEKKNLVTTWTKFYCVYQKETRIFTMIPFSQSARQDMREAFNQSTSVKLKTCVRRASDSIDKRFCFDINTDKGSDILTFQALSEEDRRSWLDAMDGREPVYSPSSIPTKSFETSLNEAGFEFIRNCVNAIEERGLEEQGLYRNCGVNSKVQKLLQLGFDRRRLDALPLDDDAEWEVKTITSAIKSYFRNLPEPLMTFDLHGQFLNAAKLDNACERVEHVHYYVHQLPLLHFKMLRLLIEHLRRVSNMASKNLMTVANLGVCFGPTLMRPKEETVAAIMDIKFCNVIVEVLIENCERIFISRPQGATVPRPPKPAHLTDSTGENGNGCSGAVTASLNQSTRAMSSGQAVPAVTNPMYASTTATGPPRARPTGGIFNSTGDLLFVQSNSSCDSLNSDGSGGGGAATSHSSKTPSPKMNNQQSSIRLAIPYAPLYPGDTSQRRQSATPALLAHAISHLQGPSLAARLNPLVQIQPSRQVRTLYECVGEHENELSFHPGQIITNVFSSKEPGWLIGTLNGKTGLIPENYVQLLP